MSQSRKHSALEAIANIIVGFGVAMLAQYIIFPRYNIHVNAPTHFAIGFWFTLVSFIRSYAIRRIFNRGIIVTVRLWIDKLGRLF